MPNAVVTIGEVEISPKSHRETVPLGVDSALDGLRQLDKLPPTGGGNNGREQVVAVEEGRVP